MTDHDLAERIVDTARRLARANLRLEISRLEAELWDAVAAYEDAIEDETEDQEAA